MTDDHVFPRSWYPDTTPPNVALWKVPCCAPCNNSLSKLEREYLVRLSLQMEPDDPATAGLIERGRRSIDPSCGRNDRDRRARAALRKRLYAELNAERVRLGLPRPPGATHWPLSDIGGMLIDAGVIMKVIEKIVRGIHYLQSGLYVEPPLAVTIMCGQADAVHAKVDVMLSRVAELRAIEPGIVVRRAPCEDNPAEAVFSIVIWGTWKFYAVITHGDRTRLKGSNPDGLIHPLPRAG